MRVFLFSRAFYPSLGGIEQVGFLLSRELARLGHRVTVATDVRADAGVDAGLDFEVMRGRSFTALVRAAREADLVHSSGFSVLSYPLAAAARKPLVITHHGYQATCLVGNGWHEGPRCEYRLHRCVRLTVRQRGVRYAGRQLARHVFGRAALSVASAHVAVSRFVEKVIRIPRTTVIYNCADTSVFNRRSDGPVGNRFLYVGRFVAEKGVDVLLRAVARCSRARSPVTLDLVGSGPLEDEYRRLARQLEIDQWVTFRGPVRGPELADAIRGSLAVVVPSISDEAFGIVAAEALACGRLALVSAAGGLPEVVEGLDCVAPAGDDDAWSRLLLRTRDDPAWRRRCEDRLPALASRFTERELAQRYLGVYEQSLRGEG